MKMLVLFANVSFETGFHIEVELNLPKIICHMDSQDRFLFFSLVSQPPEPQLVCGRNNIEIGFYVAALPLFGLDPFSGHLAVTNCSRFRVQNNSVWYQVETREGVCGNILRVKIFHTKCELLVFDKILTFLSFLSDQQHTCHLL